MRMFFECGVVYKTIIMTKIIITLFLAQSFCLAQSRESNNTIYLNEVTITPKTINIAKKKYKSKGKQNIYVSTSLNTAFFSLVKNPPSGVLSSIKLNFNQPREFQGKYAMFDLLFINTTDRDMLMTLNSTKKYRFEISENHKGEIYLDLLPLDIRLDGSFYFGIKRVDNHSNMGVDDFQLSCNSKKGDTIYSRDFQKKILYPIPNSNIKIELKIF